MLRKFAIKRLTASDLTFFEWHFRNHNVGNQKAINLNADVFIDQLYPGLPSVALTKSGRLPVDLYLYGPGLEQELNLQRKIIKFGSYKNWRLDGEFIYDPTVSPARFHVLQPNDLVLFEFTGDVEPQTVKAFFVSKVTADDRGLFRVLNGDLGARGMISMQYSEIETLIKQAAPDERHPVFELLLESDLEDAAKAGPQGLTRLYKRRSGRRLSKNELAQALRRIEELGQVGEEFVNAHFERLKSEARISAFQWESQDNAVSPYDFWYEEEAHKSFLDVKATSGGFERNIHISFPELQAMRDYAEPYYIYRLYEVGERTAKLRISREMRSIADAVLKILLGLPAGISSDGVSLSPSMLGCGPEVNLVMPEPVETP
jgi:hypothetical protein